jgi:uncharacterized protein YuzE
MRIEYDSERDLLYIYFVKPGKKVTKTKTIVPGVHADFDKEEKLIGIEILDASEFIDQKVEFDLPRIKSAAHG